LGKGTSNAFFMVTFWLAHLLVEEPDDEVGDAVLVVDALLLVLAAAGPVLHVHPRLCVVFVFQFPTIEPPVHIIKPRTRRHYPLSN